MGYRSEVHIAMTKTRFRDLIAQAPDEDTKWWILSGTKIYYPNSYMVEISFDYIKWYPECKEVAFFLQFLEDTEDGYAFCRTGEEMEDNEQESDIGIYEDIKFQNVFWIVREIRTELQA